MSNKDVALNRNEILTNLRDLDYELDDILEEGILEILVVGSGGLMLNNHLDRTTSDIDILIIDNNKFIGLENLFDEDLINEFDTVFSINSAVNFFQQIGKLLEAIESPLNKIEEVEFKNINLFTASLETMVLMKLIAMTHMAEYREDRDFLDINKKSIKDNINFEELDRQIKI